LLHRTGFRKHEDSFDRRHRYGARAGICAPLPAGADRELFEHHLAPWVGRFFADLERAEGADFYRRVGVLGRVFVDIEIQAFALPS